jgi:pyridoxal phosphate enzyme (YggS family)
VISDPKGHALTIRAEVNRVCLACGRDPAGVRIIAVSKTQTAEAVRGAVDAGFTDFGENRVQEAEGKIVQVQPRPVWHLVGHLQTNKARKAALLFDWVQSVDSQRVAESLGSGAREADKKIGVLVQVNTTSEGQKSGCEPDRLAPVLEAVLAQPGLLLAGLMTIGPLSMAEVPTRVAFQLASDLRETWRGQLPPGSMDVLSMGMSGDWPWALAHGADWLRLGKAIFGARET